MTRSPRPPGTCPAGPVPGTSPRTTCGSPPPASTTPPAYRSPSEARQAVLDAAVWAGLTLPAVLARIENGTWPGLAAFYTRYRHPKTRRKALLADWRKALAYVTAQQAKKPTQSLVRNSPTSEPPSHGGAPTQLDQDQQRSRGTPAEFQWIRTWWTALGLLEHARYTDRAGIGKRWVLRAMGEAAMKTGSRYVAFGTRSLSIATGLDHTTVAAHLRALREEDDPLIDLIENDRGLAGDLYQLRIPDEITARAGRVGWKAGKLHALRPVFRELGHPAAFVYEALEHTQGPAGTQLRPGHPDRAVPDRGVRGAGNPRRLEPRRTPRRPVGPRRRHQPAAAGRAVRLRRHRPGPGEPSP